MRYVKAILTATLCASICMPGAAGATGLDIGGFSLTRGGVESFRSSSESGLKAAIKAAFPQSRFRLSGKLTRKYLETVDVVVIGVAQGYTTEITPLSAKEQSALRSFVKHGGTAVLFCDNNVQFNPASNSFLTPFRMASDGALPDAQTLNFVAGVNDPVESGPFGTVTQLDYNWTAWFTRIGPATVLGALANGKPGLAYLPKGSFGAGSGAVVFFADSSLMGDGLSSAEDQIAILNAIALTQ